MDRRVQNRIAASYSRKRKLEHIRNLETEIQQLHSKLLDLVEENRDITEKIYAAAIAYGGSHDARMDRSAKGSPPDAIAHEVYDRESDLQTTVAPECDDETWKQWISC